MYKIFKYIKTIQGGNTGTNDISEKIGKIKSYLVSVDKKKIIANIKILDIIKKKYDIPRFKYSHLTKDEMCIRIIDSINGFLNHSNTAIINDFIK